jgi:hypothetical protein
MASKAMNVLPSDLWLFIDASRLFAEQQGNAACLGKAGRSQLSSAALTRRASIA